jgi:hypothetical protein
VSLQPTYQQLTRLSPFPGTALWERLREDGRIADVPWEDVHFWSGAQKNVAFEPHETLNITEQGYELLYRTWGPSLLRRLDVQLSGYQRCMVSDDALLRRHKSRFFKKQAAMIWTQLRAMDRFAPNGVVRRRVRKVDARYRQVIGEPTPVMQALSRASEGIATLYKAKELLDPANRSPKEEPFKRYVYDKPDPGVGVPYRTEYPGRTSLRTRLAMQREALRYSLLEAAVRGIRFGLAARGDQVIDEHLTRLVAERAWGFGF